jgi:hypothetical protein
MFTVYNKGLIGNEKFGQFLGLNEKKLALSDRFKTSTKAGFTSSNDILDRLKNFKPFSQLFIHVNEHDSVNKEQLAEYAMVAITKSIEIHVIYVVLNRNQSFLLGNESFRNFQHLIRMTGGDLYIIHEEPISNRVSSKPTLTDLISSQIHSKNEQTFLVANIDHSQAQRTHEWDFYLDENLDKVNFHVSSLSANLSLSLFEPGRLLSHVSFTHLLNSKLTRLFFIEKPSGGKWRIRINSPSGFNLKVYASSSLRFNLEIGQLKQNHEAHPDYLKMNNNPPIGSLMTVFLSGTENFKTTHLQVMAKDSIPIEDYFLLDKNRLDFLVPPTDFRLKVVACSINGHCIQRYMPKLFKPALIEIDIVNEHHLPSFIQLNEKLIVKYRIKNRLGRDDWMNRATILVRDTLNVANIIHKEQVLLQNDQHGEEITVFVNIPDDVGLIGKHISLSVIALPNDARFDFNLAFKTIHLAINNKVKQRSSPHCEIVKRDHFEQCKARVNNSNCDSNREWNSLIKITGSDQKGLHKLRVLQHEFVIGDKQRVHLDYYELDFSSSPSKQPIQFVRTTANCCSTKFSVLVYDKFSNYEKCIF